MNENVVDILIYLYENYMDSDQEAAPDQVQIQEELAQAGFPEQEIEKALEWMDELALRQMDQGYTDHGDHAMRIYTPREISRLDAESRGLLLFLEQNGILDQASRELAIDRAMALSPARLHLDDVKWVVLMVLMNQPGRESAFAQMEDLVYNDIPNYLH